MDTEQKLNYQLEQAKKEAEEANAKLKIGNIFITPMDNIIVNSNLLMVFI